MRRGRKTKGRAAKEEADTTERTLAGSGRVPARSTSSSAAATHSQQRRQRGEQDGALYACSEGRTQITL